MFGAAFVLEAGLLAWVGARRRIEFRWSRSPRALAGLLLVLYATAIYPLLGAAAGHGYPRAPLFGVAPCPTTIFTFGVLLLAAGRVPAWLLAIPWLWAALGLSAALQLGIREDLGLVASAAIAAALLMFPAAAARPHPPPAAAP